MINPPAKVKYQYWTNPKLGDDLEEWLENAEEHAGSWWPHWINWLTKFGGDLVPARIPGARLGPIEDAPGSYVRAKG